MAGGAGGTDEELLAFGMVAFCFHYGFDDFVIFHGCQEGSVLGSPFADVQAFGGFFGSFDDLRVRIIEGGENFIGVGVVFDECDCGEDLDPALRVLPTGDKGVFGGFTRFRGTGGAGAEGEECGISPNGLGSVELGRLFCKGDVMVFEALGVEEGGFCGVLPAF